MFKKFSDSENISGVTQLKGSVQRGIKTALVELYPDLEPHLDMIMPKKDSFRIVKCHDHVEILINSSGEQLFFRQRDSAWMPSLRLLHKYPFALPWEQVDMGAAKFVLSGANVMCPGLTSPGARMTPAAAGTVVAVMVEGKEHAVAIGQCKLSTEDITRVNKGIGIENVHYLNDGLWSMKPIK